MYVVGFTKKRSKFAEQKFDKKIVPKNLVRVFLRNFHTSVMWRHEKFSLTKEIFRQINTLVGYFVKPLLSRKCC